MVVRPNAMSKTPQEKLLKLAEAMEDPATFAYKETERLDDKIDTEVTRLDDSIKTISLTPGDKGEKGDTGDKGERGEKGADGKDGRDGINGKDGKDGAKGDKGDPGKDGESIKGEDGKDGSPDTPEEVRDKLESLKKEKRLDVSAIKGIEEAFKKSETDWSAAINRVMLVATEGANQTSIVGITGTKAQFNTALTDGDFLFSGDIDLSGYVPYTGATGTVDLGSQTIIAGAVEIAELSTITFTGSNPVVITHEGDNLISISGKSGFKAILDTGLIAADQTHAFPNNSGTLALTSDIPPAYTTEEAQDAVGNAVGNGLDYNDTTGAISVDETELDHGTLSGLGDDDHTIYIKADGTRAFTGSQQVQNLTVATNQTRDFGSDSNRLNSVRGRLGVFVGSSDAAGAIGSTGTRSFGSNPTGLVAGNQVQTSTGVASHYLKGGNYKGVACIGNVNAQGTGTAKLNNNAGGASVFGSAFTNSTGNAEVRATRYGNFTAAYPGTLGSGNHLFHNNGTGSFLAGYSVGTNSNFTTYVGAGGSFTNILGKCYGATALTVNNTGAGAFCSGFANATSGTHTWSVSGNGSFAQGAMLNSVFTSSGKGSFAQGYGNASNIVSSGGGAFAHGYAKAGNAITASGIGSFACGYSNAGVITASAANAVQFGVGTNALADSVQIGNSGLRLKGTTGAPGTPQNGDLWVANNYVYVRTNGVTKNMSNI